MLRTVLNLATLKRDLFAEFPQAGVTGEHSPHCNQKDLAQKLVCKHTTVLLAALRRRKDFTFTTR